MRICGKCKRVHLVSNFHAKKTGRGGLQYWCKDCKRASNREYESRAASAGRRKDSSRRYRRTESFKRVHGNTVAKRLAQSQKPRLHDRIGPAKKRLIKGAQCGLCAYCLKALPLQIDHVVGLCAGGSNTLDNAVAACGKCNRRKGSRGVLALLRDMEEAKPDAPASLVNWWEQDTSRSAFGMLAWTDAVSQRRLGRKS